MKFVRKSVFLQKIKTMKEYLVIRTAGELRQVASEHILYIVAKGRSSEVHLTNGNSFGVFIPLGEIVTMLGIQLPHSHTDFVRMGRYLIINVVHLHYINIANEQLELFDINLNTVAINASQSSLKGLSDLLDNRLNINR